MSRSGWGGVSGGNEDDIYSSFENTQYGGTSGSGMGFGENSKAFGGGGGGLGALSTIGGGGRMVSLSNSVPLKVSQLSTGKGDCAFLSSSSSQPLFQTTANRLVTGRLGTAMGGATGEARPMTSVKGALLSRAER